MKVLFKHAKKVIQMRRLNVTDVRVLPGDSGFLIDDGQTAVLCDTGFGFTGAKMAEKIRAQLGGRPLDYILLTHSHYDHVLGAPYIQAAYPGAKVIAGTYVTSIFERPTARARMRDLDRKFAHTCGVEAYEDLTDALRVDVTVEDGDVIDCGSMRFTVVALPGHTKCSIGFYLEENRLLLATETLGVYFGMDTYMPSYLVGYQMTLDSFARAKRLDIESLLIPHYGLVTGEEAKGFLENSEKTARHFAQKLREIFAAGGSEEDAMAYCREHIYLEHVRPLYPIDAFNLNTSIMIGLIRKETAAGQQTVL